MAHCFFLPAIKLAVRISWIGLDQRAQSIGLLSYCALPRNGRTAAVNQVIDVLDSTKGSSHSNVGIGDRLQAVDIVGLPAADCEIS